MTTHYGDYIGTVTSSATAYPVSYSAAGLFDLSPIAEEMMRVLPSYFYLGNNNRRLMEMVAVVLKSYDDKIDEIQDQFFVQTATWGLAYWEQLAGLPINSGGLDYETRRNAILNKLRDCSSEECFVEGLEGISNGRAAVIDLDPALNPYQVNIELGSSELVYAGPRTAPTAAAGAAGPLTGDYTYKVTYEFNPITLPEYLTLYPYQALSGLISDRSIVTQRQYITVENTGGFSLSLAGVSSSIGPFTELSTAEDIVNELNAALEDSYGLNAVSTLDGAKVVGDDGVVINFDGLYSAGFAFSKIEVIPSSGSSIVGTVYVVTDPEFSQSEITGETSSGLVPQKTNERQQITSAGSATGGFFTLKYNANWDITLPPIPEETDPIPYNATAEQVNQALMGLPSIYPGSISVSGGPLPLFPITIEFTGYEAGYPQALLMVNNANIVGATYVPTRITAGTTTYTGSESNTVSVSGKCVNLTNVPRSPDGAVRRNIYRKKNEAYNNEWRYVGSIEDNYSTIFTDDTPDSEVSEVQKIRVFGNGTFKLRFDDKLTGTLLSTSTGTDIAAAIEALAPTSRYSSIDVSADTNVVNSDIVTVTFSNSGSSVEGKDVPLLEIVEADGVVGYVYNGLVPKVLDDQNTAFTYTFQRILQYIYATKPAHIRVRELRNFAFRAGINSAGDAV